MMEFVTAPQNLPFSVSLAVMFGIALLEGITTLLGAGLSSLIENFIPDFDGDVEVDGSESVATPLSKLLGWLRIGEVPVLMLLVIFLTAFGLIGLGIQSMVGSVTGALAPGGLISVPALVLATPLVRMFGGVLARIMPNDETDAVSEESFIGRVAVITLGTASQGSPAQAKLKDEHGQTHYVMVEPDNHEDVMTQGSTVILVRRAGSVFKAIHNDNPALLD